MICEQEDSMKEVKNDILISVTAAALAYMFLYIFFLPLMGIAVALIGGLIWILAVAWTVTFIFVNFIREDGK